MRAMVKLEPANVHGAGGVVITGQTRRGNAAPLPSGLSADEVTGVFGPASALTEMTGAGHASMEQTTATGARQTASGDRVDAHFTPASGAAAGPASATGAKTAAGRGTANSAVGGAEQLQSAVIDGHVVLVQMPAQQPAAQPQPPLRATAGRAEYEGAGSAAGEWLHLTINPRVDNGSLQLTADKVDVAESSGDAFAHGNVKATWLDNGPDAGGRASRLAQTVSRWAAKARLTPLPTRPSSTRLAEEAPAAKQPFAAMRACGRMSTRWPLPPS